MAGKPSVAAEPTNATKPSVEAEPTNAIKPSVVNVPSVAREPSVAADVLQAEASVIRKLTYLARRLGTPRTTVGYSAFVLFALEKKRRPIIWEGRDTR